MRRTSSSIPTPALLLARVAASLVAVCCALSCGADNAPETPPAWTPQELELIGSLSPLPKLPPSPGNPIADDPKAAAFGQQLFFDTRLSANGGVSCATCHQPERYFTDGRPIAVGITAGQRHTPTIVGSHWAPFLFWDGRADSTWAQALGPIETPHEHGLTRVALARLIAQHHRADYEALFGPMPDVSDTARFPAQARPDPMNPDAFEHRRWMAMDADDRAVIDRVFANVGKSVEAYTRKLTPQPAPFDRYVEALRAGDPAGGGHLSVAAQRGLRAFVGEAQCVNCHNGPLLSDGTFHNIGLPRLSGQTRVDVGRSLGAVSVKAHPFRCGTPESAAGDCDELRFLNPRFEDFLGAFKTPTLRNVAKTAPYMHDGRFETLDAVLTFYKTLPGTPAVGHRELVLELLNPSVSNADLIAFLQSLTGPLPDARWLHPPSDAPAEATP